MRFLMVDRIVALEPGKRIEAVKLPSLTEECLRGHFTRAPRVPGALLIESMVQTLGWLVVVTHAFRHSVVLTVLEDAVVPTDLAPGRPLTIVGELEGTGPRGSLGRVTASIEGREVARVGRVLYGQAPNPRPELLEQRFRLLGGAP